MTNQWDVDHWSTPFWISACLAATFSISAGCNRALPPSYSPSEAVAALPDGHRQAIQSGLERLFGTPDFPRFMRPAESGDDSSNAEMKMVPVKDANHLRLGAQVYRQRCAGCHGVTGDGNGEAAAYLRPKPRDYRRGIFKFTSTPYGSKPARQDLVRVIRRGAKGTSMPSFPWMPEDELQAVVDYVILLSQRGEVESLVAINATNDYDEDEELDPAEFTDALADVRSAWESAEGEIVTAASSEPAFDEESVRLGRELYISENCWKCHGEKGEGQTEWLSHEFLTRQESLPEDQRVAINYDAWNEPAPAADLTARMLHGGRRSIDIYRRIFTGINGTPMPAFGQLYADEPDKIWHLVHYVRHIIEGGDASVP